MGPLRLFDEVGGGRVPAVWLVSWNKHRYRGPGSYIKTGTGSIRMSLMPWRTIRILKCSAGILLVMKGVIAAAGGCR